MTTVVPQHVASTCSEPECSSPVRARGWCDRHYYRNWRKAGHKSLTREQRLAALLAPGDPAACWPWQGYIGPRGYGVFKIDGKARGAHNLAYERAKGPLPDGLVVGHICHDRDLSCAGGTSCRHRACVNPAHLEAMTSRDNTLSGRTNAAVNAAKKHCVRGHEFTPENTRLERSGARRCLTCERARERSRDRSAA